MKNSELPPHQQTHTMSFTDGPLQGHEFTLTGVVPFAQFQIGGTMEVPVFHYYALDVGQTPDHTAERIAYKYMKTYTFEEFATSMPCDQPEPPTKF
jgi:hypothetical protein